MGAPMKCLACDSRWYGVGSNMCPDCGSDDVDVDAPPAKPDAKMRELVALVEAENGMDQEDERLNRFCDDRGNGIDTFNLCLQFKLLRATHDGHLDCGAVWPVK